MNIKRNEKMKQIRKSNEGDKIKKERKRIVMKNGKEK